MSEKISNTFKFYGSQAVLELEKEIANRFLRDREAGHDPYTAVHRILFANLDDLEFDLYEKTGAYGVWYYGDGDKLEFECNTCSLNTLQDYITEHVAKIDRNVVVQMDYIGNTPRLVGTRFSYVDPADGLRYACCERELNCWFCDEADYEDVVREHEENGDDPNVMTHQELDSLIADMRETAKDDFLSLSEMNDFELRTD